MLEPVPSCNRGKKVRPASISRRSINLPDLDNLRTKINTMQIIDNHLRKNTNMRQPLKQGHASDTSPTAHCPLPAALPYLISRINKLNKVFILLALSLMLLFNTGCVERFIKVSSRPPGAVVWLNDREVGTTPITVPFTWYGEYSVTLRKNGYETINTSKIADAPIYQWPGLDFISECMLPFTFKDRHEWDFDLAQQQEVDRNKLIIRAERMKIKAEQTK